MKFISNENNMAIVNLDNVTYIHISANDQTNTYTVCFVFDSSFRNEVNEVSWHFSTEEELYDIIAQLECEDISL